MIKIIMGKKGTGKTKLLIDMVNNAVTEESGDVVCLEGGRKLTHDISYAVRLVDVWDYELESGYEVLFGFICGIYAQNFDVSHIFIDSLYKVAKCDDITKAEAFIEKIERFSSQNNIRFTIMISDDTERASDNLRRYF
ncbi:MAG: hypothetical protein GX633_10425 [Clostridiales bacterium]|nr:hypothetical protein [Clostridiales bacterium]